MFGEQRRGKGGRGVDGKDEFEEMAHEGSIMLTELAFSTVGSLAQ